VIANKKAWQDFSSLYAILSVPHQWQIHDYYQPTKDLTELELRAHRKAVTALEPSLPSASGKSFEKMYAAFRIAFRDADGDANKFRRILRHFAEPGSYVEKTFLEAAAGLKKQCYVFTAVLFPNQISLVSPERSSGWSMDSSKADVSTGRTVNVASDGQAESTCPRLVL
jgi:hypothetical protein